MDVEPSSEPDRIDVRISARNAGIDAELTLGRAISVADLAAEVIPAMERIISRGLAVQELPAPEGMKYVDTGLAWLAFSEVRVLVPSDTTDEDYKSAVATSLKELGIPEVVNNPTIGYVCHLHAYGPKGPEGFTMSPSTEIELDDDLI